jgi:hypothetical protein
MKIIKTLQILKYKIENKNQMIKELLEDNNI